MGSTRQGSKYGSRSRKGKDESVNTEPSEYGPRRTLWTFVSDDNPEILYGPYKDQAAAEENAKRIYELKRTQGRIVRATIIEDLSYRIDYAALDVEELYNFYCGNGHVCIGNQSVSGFLADTAKWGFYCYRDECVDHSLWSIERDGHLMTVRRTRDNAEFHLLDVLNGGSNGRA